MIALALICAAAIAYQLVALYAVLRQARRRCPDPLPDPPSVSVLKPVQFRDAAVQASLDSHASIDYPNFEVLLGESARRAAPNPKVAKLEDLEHRAAGAVIVVNDADIVVPAEYLRVLTAELAHAGLVTCLYRAQGHSFAAQFEALGIATDFAPGALVAPLTGVREFGLGSTLAMSAETLKRIGGFAAVRDYIADDYQIGKRVNALGLRVSLSCIAVSTWLHGRTLADVWRHQVRWARTIRCSRGAYFGMPITFATLWAILAALAGWWGFALALIELRMIVGLVCGVTVLRDPVTTRFWWLMPLRDLFGVAVWCAGAYGDTVEWSGQRMKLDRSGRIVAPAG